MTRNPKAKNYGLSTEVLRDAVHWKPDKEGRVICQLSPRKCKISPGKRGFCGVRVNHNGRLYTINYGVSVELAEERIETEAVYHYRPGSRILSLGNIGCMLNCDFCHNWKTSQYRKLDDSKLSVETPETVIQTATDNGIEVLSWTYNDPVVWQEFVVDTALASKKYGSFVNLYKSALYIAKEPLDELIELMDIFSISLKSMSEEFYRKIAKGELGPVLQGIKQIAATDRHLEISQLVIPGLNDTEAEARKTARWIIDHCGPHVPLHFVAFHPDYKYQNVQRTRLESLQLARSIALDEGIRHCYVGNSPFANENNSHCKSCNSLLVDRVSGDVKLVNLSADGWCEVCGKEADIQLKQGTGTVACAHGKGPGDLSDFRVIEWPDSINNLHISVRGASYPGEIFAQHQGEAEKRFVGAFKPGQTMRFTVTRKDRNEESVRLYSSAESELIVYLIEDRAHFPTDELRS